MYPLQQRLYALVFPLLVAFLTSPLLAQEAAEGAAPHAGHKSWWDLFKTTGPVGVLLLLTSMIGTSLLIMYILALQEKKMVSPELMAEVEELLSQGNVEDAYSTAESDPTYAGKVMTVAIGRSVGGYDEARKGLEESAGAETFRLNSKLSLLSLVGNIGPLLGLLGTVTGMISSFQVIEQLKSPTPKDLAVGVYESLVNTTIGLFIAIVFLSAYFFLKNRCADITLKVNTEISDMLARTMGQGADQSAKS